MDERIPHFRSRVGRRRSPSPWLFVFIFVFFSGMLFILFLRSPLSKIEKIHISGQHLVTTEEILAKTRMKKGVSYFSIDESRAEQTLTQLPEVKRVSVDKTFPNQVYIRVEEWPPVAIFQTEDQKLLPILSNGTILTARPYTSDRPKQPIFRGWVRKNPTFTSAVKQVARLPESIRATFISISPVANDAEQVEIKSDQQHQIFVRANEITAKCQFYPSFYQHPPGMLYLLESIWFAPRRSGKPRLQAEAE
jgi:cell division protein FtsQ